MAKIRTEEEAAREAEELILDHVNDIPVKLKIHFSLEHIVGAINVAKNDLLARPPHY